MPITRAESLVDAFAKMYGYHTPFSRAYELRNPMMLRAFSPKHIRTEDGYRIFNNFTSGYDNGLMDIKIKCSGKSHTHLTPENTLDDLTRCYGNPSSATRYVVKFLKHVWPEEYIHTAIHIGWFLEDAKENLPSS